MLSKARFKHLPKIITTLSCIALFSAIVLTVFLLLGFKGGSESQGDDDTGTTSHLVASVTSASLYSKIYGDDDNSGASSTDEASARASLSVSEIQNNMYFDLDATPVSIDGTAYAGTATFRGLKNGPISHTIVTPTPEFQTLVIPSVYEDATGRYLVTKVGVSHYTKIFWETEFDGSMTSSHLDGEILKGSATFSTNNMNMQTEFAQNQWITAVVIPDTVNEIEEAAFYGFGSIEYLKTPIIGQYIDTETKDSHVISKKDIEGPLASMFSTDKDYTSTHKGVNGKPYNWDISDGAGYVRYYGLDQDKASKLYPAMVAYYKDNPTDRGNYFVPKNLHTVVVTKDTGLVNRAFFAIDSLYEVELGDSVKDLSGEYIFSDCKNLVRVTMPNTVSSIGRGMFAQCKNLGNTDDSLGGISTAKSMITTSSIEAKYPGAFTLPKLMHEISEGIFFKCEKLVTVNMPSSVDTIYGGAFYGCEKLENLNIYDAQTAASTRTYTKEGDFNLPNGIVSIGKSAFRDCKKFTRIIVPTTNNTIANQTIGAAAFNGCISVESVELPFVGSKRGNSKTADSCFGYIFGKSGDAWFFSEGSPTLSGGTSGTQVSTSGSYGAAETHSTGKTDTFYIPNTLKVIQITAETVIGPGALQGLNSVTTLTLNDELTSFAEGALAGDATNATSYALTTLSVPFVGTSFEGSRINQLGSMFGKNNYTGGTANASGYYLPNKLTTVKVNNQRTIGNSTFYDVPSLTTVEISKNTKFIEEQAFYACQNLSDLTIPFVGHNRGYYYYYMQDQLGPDSCGDWHSGWWRYYGWGPDNYIRNSLAFIFSRTNSNKHYRVSYAKWDGFYCHYVPEALTKVTITDDMSIASSAFQNCKNLEEVTLTASEHIDDSIFAGCQNIKTLNLPYIGRDANKSLTSSTKYTIGYLFGSNSNPTYYYQAYEYDTYGIPLSLEEITLAPSVDAVTDYAFANLESLKKVTFKQSVTEGGGCIEHIGNYAFANCSNLTSISAPKSNFTTVGDGAYQNCKGLLNYTDFSINVKTLTHVGAKAFYGTSLVSTPSNKIDFSRILSFGDYSFANCIGLEAIDLSKNDTVNTKIGTGVFSDNAALYDVKLGENLVGPYMFKNDVSLIGIDLRGITTSIPDGMFYGCDSLEGYSSAATDPTSEILLDVGTKKIGNYAFYGCETLQVFDINADVLSIGEYAFGNCTGLTSMTMPESVQTISPNGWIGCTEGFCFYVYRGEDYWPAGWVNNWNCDFPVYVLGAVNADLFTYQEYKIPGTTNKCYYITGVASGKTLPNTVEFPTRYNGLNVYGIVDGGVIDASIDTTLDKTQFVTPTSGRAISKQYNLNTIILPASYNVLLNGPFSIKENASPTANDKRVDIFAYATTSQLESNFGPSETWNKIAKDAVIYPKELWSMEKAGTKVTGDVPTIDLSKFTVELYDDGETNFVYTGNEVIMKIKKVLSPAVYTNTAVSNVIFDIGTTATNMINYTGINTEYNTLTYTASNSLFTLSYLNNIDAGKATVECTMSDYMLKQWNTERSKSSLGQLYFKNKVKANYTIDKATVTLYPVGTERVTYSKKYDTNPYIINQWGVGNVDDLGPDFKFTGTLETKGSTAGDYIIDLDIQNDFKLTDWYVRTIGGTDVSSNFKVEYGELKVTIEPQEVTVLWTGGVEERYNDVTTPYSYRYIGEIIKPTAVAVILEYDGSSYTPNEQKRDDTLLAVDYYGTNKAELIGSYGVTAKAELKDTHNYKLLDRYGNVFTDPLYPGINTNHYALQPLEVIQGLIKIKANVTWKIGYDDCFWSVTYNDTGAGGAYLNGSGLGPNSVISGMIATAGHEHKTYSSSSTDPTLLIDWVPSTAKYTDLTGTKQSYAGAVSYVVNSSRTDNYHIYNSKYKTTSGLYREENEMYDVEIELVVTIDYNDFEFQYLIDNVPQKYVDGTDSDEGGNKLHEITYKTKGGKHTFTAEATNVTDSLVKVQYAWDDGYKNLGPDPLQFDLINSYRTYVSIERPNFNVYRKNVRIYNTRSDVIVTPFDKEWDELQVNAEDHVTDYANNTLYKTQTITATYYLKSDTAHTSPLSSPPSDIGEYTVHLQVLYPGTIAGQVLESNMYYNNYDKWIDFKITPRSLYIDLDKIADYYSNLIATKPYDGVKVLFDSTLIDAYLRASYNSSTDTPKRGLLPQHTFTGIIQTNDITPQVYSNNLSFWTWTQDWAVYEAGVFGNMNKYYDVKLTGSFEITKLDFVQDVNYTLTTFDVPFDGLPHQVVCTVLTLAPGITATVRYDWGTGAQTFCKPFVNADDNPYQVTVSLSAPCYNPLTISTTNWIRKLNFTYDLVSPDGIIKKYASGTLNEYNYTQIDKNGYSVPASIKYNVNTVFFHYDTNPHTAGITVTAPSPAPVSIKYKVTDLVTGNVISVKYKTDLTGKVMKDANGNPIVESDWIDSFYEFVGKNGENCHYRVDYEITYPNYEDVTGEYFEVYVLCDEFPNIDPADIDVVPYVDDFDNALHNGLTKCELKSSFAGIGSSYTIEFSTTSSGPWDPDITHFQYKDVGTYDVYYKIIVAGYQPFISYETCEIKEVAMTGSPVLTVSGYTGVYDAKDHSVTVAYTNFSGLTTYEQDNLNIGYTTNASLFTSKSTTGWTYVTGATNKNDLLNCPITYKDAGTYDIYVMVECPNHTPEFYQAKVVITQATLYGKVELDEVDVLGTYELNNHEYTGYSFDSKKLFVSDTDALGVCTKDTTTGRDVNTIHDGKATYYFYNAILSGGAYVKDGTTRISAPIMMGYYYVEIHYKATANCDAMVAKGVFRISERIIHLISQTQYDADTAAGLTPYDFVYLLYQDKYEYDGAAHSPSVQLVSFNDRFGNTIPSDNIVFQETLSGAYVYPSTIGTYTFDIVMSALFGSGVNLSNYKLEANTVDMEITKRNIELVIYKNAVYNGDTIVYHYQTTDFVDSLSKTDNTGFYKYKADGTTNDKVTMTGSFLTGHYFELDFSTYSGMMMTYYYPPKSIFFVGNKINLNSCDVYDNPDATDPTRTSVGMYYNITINEIVVLINRGDYEGFTITDTVVPYDGESHQVYEGPSKTSNIANEMMLNDPNITCSTLVLYSFNETGPWFSDLSQTEVGEYEIWVNVSISGYNTYIAKCKLIIEKIDLNVTKSYDGQDVYDGTVHKYTANVTNVTGFSDKIYVKYFDKAIYDLDELKDLYGSNFGTSNKFFHLHDQGLDEYEEAHEYYVVIYIEGTDNYNYYSEIFEWEYERRPVYVDLKASYVDVVDYSKQPYVIFLTGSDFDVKVGTPNTGILPGHTYLSSSLAVSTIRTKSANAGHYGPSDFLFDNMYIYEGTKLVTQNYRPEIMGVIDITINKIHLRNPEFYVTDLVQTKEYDGLPNVPDYFCDSDGAKTYTYYAWDPVTNTISSTPLAGSFISDAGNYYVVVDVAEGTNYYAWSVSPDYYPFGIYLKVTKKKVEIEWDNLSIVFDNKDHAPDVWFYDIANNKVNLSAVFYYGGEVSYKKRAAGSYICYAENLPLAYQKNYEIENPRGIFEITKAHLTYTIKEEDRVQYDSTRPWTVDVAPSDVTDMIPGLNFYSASHGTAEPYPFAILSTASSAAGVYDYQGSFVWDIQILDESNPSDILDVTDSIEIEIIGTVTIYSMAIQYKKDDVYTYYTGSNHTVWEGLEIIFPDVKKISILYSVQDSLGNWSDYTTDEPECKEVGDYIIKFKLTANGYESAEDIINIHVAQAQAQILLTKSLDKKYDGKIVDKSTIAYNGRFNGLRSDLVFEIYDSGVKIYDSKAGSGLTTPPYDVGTYRLHIYSLKDYDASGNPITDQNYSVLDYWKDFTISPAELDLSITIDKTVYLSPVDSNTELGKPYSYTGKISAYSGLGINDEISYEFSAAAIQRGIWQLSKYDVSYNAGLLSGTNFVTYTNISSDNGGENFAWRILNAVRKDPLVTTDPFDTSFNYNIKLTIYFDVHYPRMDDIVSVGDVVVEYDGMPHDCLQDNTVAYKGTAVYSSDPKIPVPSYGVRGGLIDLTGRVSLLFSEDNETFSTSAITFTDPIVDKVIYVKFVANAGENFQYEDCVTSYKLTIKFLKRAVTTSYNDYSYDSTRTSIGTKTVSTYVDWSGKTFYLPDTINVVLGTKYGTSTTLADWSVYEDVAKCVYYKNGYPDELTEIKDAGTYSYRFTIPASTFYEKTVVTGVVTIARRTIYVVGQYTTTYNGNSVKYGDFMTSGSAYKLSLTPDGLTSIPTGMSLTGVLMTSGADVGTYNTISSKLISWENATYTITQSGVLAQNNYQCSLSAASIQINKGTIKVLPPTLQTHGYEKDKYWYPSVDVVNPHSSQIVSITYQPAGKTEFMAAGTAINQFEGYNEIGTYVTNVKINCGTNYEDVVVPVTLEVTRAITTLSFPSMTKVFNNEEVGFPTTRYTNNPELGTEEDDFDITYYQLVGGVWVPCKNPDRPINVGHYKIHVQTQPTQHYSDYNGDVQEFDILAYELNINWLNDEFVYNGEPQEPIPAYTAPGGKLLPLTLVITDESSGTVVGGSGSSIDAGSYSIKATISDPNYTIKASGSSHAYQIIRRKLTVSLNGTGNYDGSNKYIQYEENLKAAGIVGVAGYAISNLVAGHSTTSIIKVLNPNAGRYTNSAHFQWMDKSFVPTATGDIEILDASLVDVSHNYLISYSLIYEIDYSTIVFSAPNKVEVYDGFKHSLDYTLSNVGKYTVFATTTISNNLNDYKIYDDYKNVRYEDGGFAFTDVFLSTVGGVKTVGSYPVYFVVVPTDDIAAVKKQGSLGLAAASIYTSTMTIDLIPSNLQLANPLLALDKIYDGKCVDNPDVTYENMLLNPRKVYYDYYKLDAAGNPETTSWTNAGVVAAGQYRLVISLAPSDNYDDKTLTIDFEVKKRPVTVFYPAQDTRTYDLLTQRIDVETSKVVGIVPGDTFKGILQTSSADVGDYRDYTLNEFTWVSGYTLTNPTVGDVTNSYDVSVNAYIRIVEADIEYDLSSYNGVYDGYYHTISLNVKNPPGCTIGFTTDPTAFTTSLDDATLMATKFNSDINSVAQKFVGEITVYVMIMKTNYTTVKTTAKIIIKGLTLTNSNISLTGQVPGDSQFQFDQIGDDFNNLSYLVPAGSTSISLGFTIVDSTGYITLPGSTTPITLTDTYVLAGTATSTTPETFNFVYYSATETAGKPFKVDVYAYDASNPFGITLDGEVSGQATFTFDYIGNDFSNKGAKATYVPTGSSSIDLTFTLVAPGAYIEYAGATVPLTDTYALNPTIMDATNPSVISFTYYDTVNPSGVPFNVYVYASDNGILGKKNANFNYDGDVYYSGMPYMESKKSDGTVVKRDPTVKAYNNSDWVQTVEYFLADKDGKPTGSPLPGAPTDIGKYVFVITVKDAPSMPQIHSPATFEQSFAILPKPVTIVWNDISVDYDGNSHIPTAEYVDVNGATISLVVNPSSAQTNAGTGYLATTSITDPNYTYTGTTNQTNWDILKQKVTKPSINTSLTFEYGDAIVIEDISGNKYTINSDGSFTLEDPTSTPIDVTAENGLYTMAIDANLDADRTYGQDHKLVVSLKDQANYMWSDDLKSTDYEVKYTISPKKLTYADLTATYTNRFKYTGSAFTPDMQLDYGTTTLVCQNLPSASPTTVTPYDFIIAFPISANSNNVDINWDDTIGVGVWNTTTNKFEAKTGAELSHITVTGDKNYEFYDAATGNNYLTYDFKIAAKDPELIMLKSTAKVEFIECTRDSSKLSITINETNSTTLTSTVVRTDPKAKNFGDIYLGHLYQNNTVQTVLDQIDNVQANLKVVDYTGATINPADYATTIMGTNWTIELYNDSAHTTKLDSIKTILYGDINGDGYIMANDGQVINNYLNAKKDSKGDLMYDFATMDAPYLFAMNTTGSEFIMAKNTQMINNLLNNSGDPSYDFNNNYQ